MTGDNVSEKEFGIQWRQQPYSFLFFASPFGFAGADKASLFYMREAEIKHSRLAMLACVGFPISELFDKPIADAVGLPTVLTKWGGSPSLVNGGLRKIDVLYWIAELLNQGRDAGKEQQKIRRVASEKRSRECIREPGYSYANRCVLFHEFGAAQYA
jgi:hypothetical protein